MSHPSTSTNRPSSPPPLSHRSSLPPPLPSLPPSTIKNFSHIVPCSASSSCTSFSIPSITATTSLPSVPSTSLTSNPTTTVLALLDRPKISARQSIISPLSLSPRHEDFSHPSISRSLSTYSPTHCSMSALTPTSHGNYASTSSYTHITSPSIHSPHSPSFVDALKAQIIALKAEVNQFAHELSSSIRRELELEDELDRCRPKSSQNSQISPTNLTTPSNSHCSPKSTKSLPNPTPQPDLISPPVNMAKLLAPQDPALQAYIQDLEKARRNAEQINATLRIEFNSRLQEESRLRAQAESDLRQTNSGPSLLYDRLRSLESANRQLHQSLEQERAFKRNFQCLLTSLRKELGQYKAERDSLRSMLNTSYSPTQSRSDSAPPISPSLTFNSEHVPLYPSHSSSSSSFSSITGDTSLDVSSVAPQSPRTTLLSSLKIDDSSSNALTVVNVPSSELSTAPVNNWSTLSTCSDTPTFVPSDHSVLSCSPTSHPDKPTRGSETYCVYGTAPLDTKEKTTCHPPSISSNNIDKQGFTCEAVSQNLTSQQMHSKPCTTLTENNGNDNDTSKTSTLLRAQSSENCQLSCNVHEQTSSTPAGNTLTHTKRTVNTSDKDEEYDIAEQLADLRNQRDALHSALKSLLDRQTWMTKEHNRTVQSLKKRRYPNLTILGEKYANGTNGNMMRDMRNDDGVFRLQSKSACMS